MTDSKKPIGFSDMFKAYDPKNMSSFFDPGMFTSWFQANPIAGLDPTRMMEDHRDRLEALGRANTEAMKAYQAQIERQAKVFDDVMKAAQDHIGQMEVPTSAEAAQKNLAVYSEAVDTAIGLMRRLSEETQAAAEEVHAKVSEEVEKVVQGLSKP